MPRMRAHDVSQTAAFIDLHQDMLSGVAKLDGGFGDYGASYLTGSSHAAAIFSFQSWYG